MMIPRTGRLIAVAGLAFLAAGAGCGSVKSAPAPASYGREGPAIGLSREQRQGDRVELAQEEKAREAESRRQEVAAATQAAVAQVQQAEVKPAKAANGQIKHVVVMWLKKPGDAAVRKQLIDARSAMATIPGVVDVSAGEVVKSDRAVVDSSYDVAFVVTFDSAESLKAYGPHPTHQKLVDEIIKPNVEKYLVYDFVTP